MVAGSCPSHSHPYLPSSITKGPHLHSAALHLPRPPGRARLLHSAFHALRPRRSSSPRLTLRCLPVRFGRRPPLASLRSTPQYILHPPVGAHRACRSTLHHRTTQLTRGCLFAQRALACPQPSSRIRSIPSDSRCAKAPSSTATKDPSPAVDPLCSYFPTGARSPFRSLASLLAP